jgi:hypothetical protein
MSLCGEAAGTTITSNSPVRRAIGIVWERLTGLLLAISAPTMTMPATMMLFCRPFHWLTNCGRPTAPPAPGTLVTWAVLICLLALSTASMVRPV